MTYCCGQEVRLNDLLDEMEAERCIGHTVVSGQYGMGP